MDRHDETPGDILKPTELAKEIKVPVRTLGQWRYLGRGPAYFHVGNAVRYRRTDVAAWIEANLVLTAPDAQAGGR